MTQEQNRLHWKNPNQESNQATLSESSRKTVAHSWARELKVTGIGETKTNETKQRFPSRITTPNRTKNHEVKTGWRSKTRSCHCCQNTKSPRQRAAQRPKSGKNLAPLAPTLTRNRRRAKRQRPTKKSRAGTGRHGESCATALEQKRIIPSSGPRPSWAGFLDPGKLTR
jgi:hypothetical protein